MPDITIETDSPSYRVCKRMAADATLTMSRNTVAMLLGVAIGAVDNALNPAIEQALITTEADGVGGRLYRAGPRLKLWQAAAAPAAPAAPAARVAPAAPVAPAATPAKRTRGMARLPALDITTLVVASNVPIPGLVACAKGKTKYDQLLDLLTEDGRSVTGIEVQYRDSIGHAINSYLRHRPALRQASMLCVRQMPDRPGYVGVWRVKRDPNATPMGRPPRAAKAAAKA